MTTENRLRILAGKILKEMKIKNANVGVFFLPDKEMIRLKKRFMPESYIPGKVVDVLSFAGAGDFPYPDNKERYLGEVYINSKFKRDKNKSTYLMIHGVLHIRGFKHERKGDIIKMEKMERRMMRKSNYGFSRNKI